MDSLFKVHLLNDQGKRHAHLIADQFDMLLTYLESVCPTGREMSIVRTKLEEASFFAKKAMASKVENQLEG